MEHMKIETRSALPIEAREGAGGDDPIAVAVTAVEELRTAQSAFVSQQNQSAETLRTELRSLTERLDALDVRTQRPGGGNDNSEPSVETRAFGTYLRRGAQGMPETELRSLRVASDPNGGYLAPAEFSTEMIRNLVQISPIRSIASVRTTSSPAVIYPKRTGVTNATWRGEGQTRTETDPTFGQAEVPIKEVSTYVDISNQLLADTGGNAEAEIRQALAEDFAQKEGLAFVSGDGVLAPTGFMTDASVGVVAAGSTTALSADALISILYALPAAYRARSSWVMNGTTLAALRKLKDSTGQLLWQPALAAGQPETLLSRPVVEAVDMPDVASNAFPIAVGAFDLAFRIVDRLDLSVLVDPYTQATRGFTRIHATKRCGSGVIQPGAMRKLKMSAS